MQQSKKSFHIRLPEQAYRFESAFVKWINSHITPGLPTAKTKIDPSSTGNIYKKFMDKLHRMINLELLNASLKVKGEPLLTQEELDFWFKNQSIEISVEEITPGRFNCQAMMMGPAISTVENKISIGYENITRFQITVYFKNDYYFLLFSDSEAGKIELVPENATPVKVFPVLDYSYEMSKDKTKPAKTCEILLGDYQNHLLNFFNKVVSEFPDGKDKKFYDTGTAEMIRQLSLQMRDASAIVGGLKTPWMFSAYTIEIPKKTGSLFLTMASVSFGRRMNFMLPTLEFYLTEQDIIVLRSEPQ